MSAKESTSSHQAVNSIGLSMAGCMGGIKEIMENSEPQTDLVPNRTDEANMKIRTEKVIDVSEWDALVEKTYGRPYSFQQQDGCRNRGVFRFSVPAEAEDHERNSVPEIVNHDEMGVSFAAWLKRDPKAPLANGRTDYSLDLWWERNFYPDVQMVANDLHARGLLDAGDYTIDIDW